MKTKFTNICPDILHARPWPEVQKLMSAAHKDGAFGRNWNVILNTCLWTLLSPIYGKQAKKKEGV